MHCEVTLAVHDMNGFAPLGRCAAAAFKATPEIDVSTWKDPEAQHTFILDLLDGQDSVDEKEISMADAVRLSGLPEDQIIQIGRQRLAQIEDTAR